MDRDHELEKLTSHEEFQERVVVVSFKYWIAVGVIGFLVLCTTIWSIFGRIAVSVQGEAVFWSDHAIYGIVPFEGGALIREQMPVHLAVSSADVKKYGYLQGVVQIVYPYLQPVPDALQEIPLQVLQDYIVPTQPYILIAITPDLDPETPTGYKWTTKKGAPFPIEKGTLASISVIMDQKRPISYLIPGIQ